MVNDQQAARERTTETLERVGRVLAAPRVQGQPWQLPEPEPRSAPTPQPQAPMPAVSRGWVQRKIGEAVEAMIEGTAKFTSQQLNAQRLRITEAERRIAELESRLEDLTR